MRCQTFWIIANRKAVVTPASSMPFSAVRALRVIPAIAAGMTSKSWYLTEVVRVIEDWEARHTTRLVVKILRLVSGSEGARDPLRTLLTGVLHRLTY